MTTDKPDAAEILEVLQALNDQADPEPGLGLRERKKRLQRQRISDTATALFLTQGFEHVTVAQIAAACEASEQTVFNYFPTKESMFFDRSDDAAHELAAVLRERDGRPLSEAVVGVLLEDGRVMDWPGLDEAQGLRLFRLFCETADGSPTLVAAQNGDLVRLTTIVAGALAERVGADPEDPQVQITAIVILGLAHTMTRATFRHVHQVTTIAALEAAVRSDVQRAADVVAACLDVFDNPGT